MQLSFNLVKAAQAVAVLLREQPARRMSHLRLLTLLYLADREMFTEKLRTITGDQNTRTATRISGPLANLTSLAHGSLLPGGFLWSTSTCRTFPNPSSGPLKPWSRPSSASSARPPRRAAVEENSLAGRGRFSAT